MATETDEVAARLFGGLVVPEDPPPPTKEQDDHEQEAKRLLPKKSKATPGRVFQWVPPPGAPPGGIW